MNINKYMEKEDNIRWDQYHEKLLKKWAEICKTYSIMHTLCAQYYSKWHKRLGIPVVIIGGVTASSIFSSNKENSDVWIYINGSLALLVAGLAGVSNFLGTSEKTIKHQTASFKYSKIGMDIDAVLCFSRKERKESGQEYILKKKLEMLEIRENVPEVLPWVISHYINKHKSLTNNIKSTANNNYEKPKNVILDEFKILNSSSSETLRPPESIIRKPVFNNFDKIFSTNKVMSSKKNETVPNIKSTEEVVLKIPKSSNNSFSNNYIISNKDEEINDVAENIIQNCSESDFNTDEE